MTATPPLTAAELGQWREHLRAGRKHADAREWAPGVREFEAALKLTPEDATAANELAWAALQAGDIAKARKAGEAALRGAADPRLKAAAFYNLGRIAEREGDSQAARSYYERSMDLRPNQEVVKRHAALANRDSGALPGLPCTRPQPLTELCTCLRKAQENIFTREVTTPDSLECNLDEKVGIPGARLLLLANGSSELVYFVVAGKAPNWAVIGELFHAQVNDHHEDRLASVMFREKPLGPARLLWAEYAVSSTSGDGRSVRESRTEMAAVCVLSGAPGPQSAPSCLLNAPLARAGVVTLYVGAERKDSQPFSSKYKVELSLDGTAQVVQVENLRDDRFDADTLGPRRLW